MTTPDNDDRVMTMTQYITIPVQDLRPDQARCEVEASRSTIRSLHWKVKQLGKQLGKAGATIHQQRGTIAALRQAVAITPGDLERYFASSDDLRAVNHQLRAEVERLREKLTAKEEA